MAESDLIRVFNSYSNRRGRLESRGLNKMLKDAGLVKPNATTAMLDIVFIKHRSKSSRSLDYQEFLGATSDIAATLKITAKGLVDKLSTLSGSQYSGIATVATRFHDDKASYTGVHVHGGPSVVDTMPLFPEVK